MNDDQNKPPATAGSPAAVTEIPTENIEARRRFIRASAVGGAVLLTLHNRAAWGGQTDKICVSENVWESYMAGAASALERHGDKEEIQKFQEALNSDAYKKPAVPGDANGEICLHPVQEHSPFPDPDPSTPPGSGKGGKKHDGGNGKGKGKSGWNRNGRP